MQSKWFTRLSLGLICPLLLIACSEDSDPQPETVEISFVAVAGETPIDCSSNLTGLGTTSATGSLKDLRFYISNVALINSAGESVPLELAAEDQWNATRGSDRVSLVDLEDNTGSCTGTAATNRSIQGQVPAGDYVGVQMTLGVPFALNHTDQTADASVTPRVVNNANHPGMAWSWAGGRKFTKIEVTNPSWLTESDNLSAATFNVHLGSTGCEGENPAAGLVNSCKAPNRLDFSLPSFDPATQRIAVDVKALLAENDVTRNQAAAVGCMSGATDPECEGVFAALAIGWAADGSGNGLPLDGSPQQLFRAISQ